MGENCLSSEFAWPLADAVMTGRYYIVRECIPLIERVFVLPLRNLEPLIYVELLIRYLIVWYRRNKPLFFINLYT